MSRVLTGEEFAAVYTEQFPKVVRLLIHYGLSGAEAEDAAQEAFLSLMHRSKQAPLIQNMLPYLFAVARNLATRQIHRRRNEILVDEDFNQTAAMDFTGAIEDQEVVRQLLEDIPHTQRDTFLLVYTGFSPAEISRMLNVSEATVRSNLRHARNFLKERLRSNMP